MSVGICLNCGHHEDWHGYPEPRLCDDERDHEWDRRGCSCPGLRLCAACEGDPEAHDMHVCERRASGSRPCPRTVEMGS